MTEQDQPLEPSALSFLWKKQTIIAMAENISPRLARLLAAVAAVLNASTTKDFSQEQKEAIGQAFQEMQYPKYENSGPICRISDPGLKYYRCFTCELMRGSCICERCFHDPKHLHHEFKLITTGTCYCDCGNEECLRKDHFCPSHGQSRKDQREQRDPPAKKEADLFTKQVEFLLTIGLLSKLTSDENSCDKAEFLSTKAFEMLLVPCTNSFTYQRLAGELLLLQPRKEFKIGDSSSLLHQWFWVESQSDSFLKAFSKLLCQLYSHEPLRRRIVVEYFNLHTSEERKVIWVSPLTEIDSQYFLEGRLILKLLRSNAIGPLTVNYRFTTINSSAGCFIQVYRAYRIMAETSVFPEILEETLKRVNFSSFYRFAIIDRESRAAVDIVSKHFLVFLRVVMRTLQKLQAREEAELKIIRESYQYIKSKEEVFNYCPERTLCWALFSHLKCSLEQLPLMSIPQILAIFGQSSPSILQETLERMLESYFNLLRIENYSDYCELTSQKFELNSSNRIVAALDFICLRTVLALLRALGRQEVLPLRNIAIGQVIMLEKWVHLYRVEQIKREAITEPDAKAQVVTLMETGLFIKPEDQAAGTTIEVVAIFNNILFASESSLCELVLANVIGHADREKVLDVYREYAWLHPNKNRKDMKQAIEGMVDNPTLVKQFIQSEWQSYSKGEKTFSYQSNLSYCSRFFNDELTDDTMQRLRKKLSLPHNPSSRYSQSIFSDEALRHLVKYIRCFVKFITGPHIDIKETSSLSGTFNLLLESLLVLYMQTRASRLKEAFLELNGNPLLTTIFTDYSKIIVQIVLDCLAKGQLEAAVKEERPEAQRKEAARARREQMMRQMRERQGRILEEHTPPPEPQPAGSQSIETCIICKTGSSPQQSLSFLCNMRFTNTLPKNILQTASPLLLMTTCGHLIHEGCLADNIDSQDEYGTDYHCFLCKQLSNLRIPLTLTHPETFTQYLLTMVSIELSGNPSLRAKEKEYTHLPTVGRLLYESIVNAIYLYYFSVGRFYNNCIRPIVRIQVALLKWITQQLHLHLPHPQGKEKRLRMVEEKVHSLVYNRQVESSMFASHCEKLDQEHIEQLFGKIMSSSSHTHNHPPLKQIKCLQRLNFFALPRDLRALSRQLGKCRGCSRLNNRTLACFLCGFKLCADCSVQMNQHVDSHLGTTVLIDLETGKYSYRYRNIQMAMASLYANYVGEEFSSEIELPPEGEFELSQERLEKLIDEVLRDGVQNTVEEYVREMEAAPACNVQ